MASKKNAKKVTVSAEVKEAPAAEVKTEEAAAPEVKTESAKKTTDTAKETVTKADEKKPAEKKVAEKKAAEKKPAEKKAAEKKPVEKKAAEPKKAAEKAKDKVIVQFAGKEYDSAKIVESCKAAYRADNARKQIRAIEVYIKPEENKAYYVVNGKAEGLYIEL